MFDPFLDNLEYLDKIKNLNIQTKICLLEITQQVYHELTSSKEIAFQSKFLLICLLEIMDLSTTREQVNLICILATEELFWVEGRLGRHMGTSTN